MGHKIERLAEINIAVGHGGRGRLEKRARTLKDNIMMMIGFLCSIF